MHSQCTVLILSTFKYIFLLATPCNTVTTFAPSNSGLSKHQVSSQLSTLLTIWNQKFPRKFKILFRRNLRITMDRSYIKPNSQKITKYEGKKWNEVTGLNINFSILLMPEQVKSEFVSVGSTDIRLWYTWYW